jgi:hypothetical protein
LVANLLALGRASARGSSTVEGEENHRKAMGKWWFHGISSPRNQWLLWWFWWGDFVTILTDWWFIADISGHNWPIFSFKLQMVCIDYVNYDYVNVHM